MSEFTRSLKVLTDHIDALEAENARLKAQVAEAQEVARAVVNKDKLIYDYDHSRWRWGYTCRLCNSNFAPSIAEIKHRDSCPVVVMQRWGNGRDGE